MKTTFESLQQVTGGVEDASNSFKDLFNKKISFDIDRTTVPSKEELDRIEGLPFLF